MSYAECLIDAADARGADTLVVSEYGITKVTDSIDINRHLRRANLLAVREESGMEQLDAGASDAFAVADHQLAHVYVKQAERVEEVRTLLQSIEGLDTVLAGEELSQLGLDHGRSGDLVAISAANRWFSYYHWLDAARAPDYSRTVDIHRKPGYDPVELFVNPRDQATGAQSGFYSRGSQTGFQPLDGCNFAVCHTSCQRLAWSLNRRYGRWSSGHQQ